MSAIRGYARGVCPTVNDDDPDAVYDAIIYQGDKAVADELIRREWMLIGIVEIPGEAA
jgi:hypothetical protein